MPKSKFVIFILFFLLSLPALASAYTGEFYVDTGREKVNAIEGVIKVPNDVTITDLQTGQSVVLIWLKSPSLDKITHIISFSGITPGGFRGKQTLFSFSGELNNTDLNRFTYSQVSALKDDGSGTAAKVTLSARSASEISEDSIPPETFVPTISRSEDLFGGKPFVTFLSQDKGVGMDRYEYASTWLLSPSENEWKPGISPQEIKTSELFKKIYIRAIDKADNQQTVHILGTYYYAGIMIGIIIISCALLFVLRSFL